MLLDPRRPKTRATRKLVKQPTATAPAASIRFRGSRSSRLLDTTSIPAVRHSIKALSTERTRQNATLRGGRQSPLHGSSICWRRRMGKNAEAPADGGPPAASIAAMAERVRNIDTSTAPLSLPETDRALIAAMEKQLLAKYEDIVSKLEDEEAPANEQEQGGNDDDRMQLLAECEDIVSKLEDEEAANEQEQGGNDDDRMEIEEEQPPPPPPPPPRRRPEDWIIEERKVQKYWDANRTAQVSRDDLENDFLGGFRANEGAELDADSYAVIFDGTGELYWKVQFDGAPSAVKLLCGELDEWMKYKVEYQNYQLTEARGDTVRVAYDASQKLGATLDQVKRHKNPLGLLIKPKLASSPFASIVGDRANICAIVDKVGVERKTCKVTWNFKKIIANAAAQKVPMVFDIKCLRPEDAGMMWFREEHIKDAIATSNTAAIERSCGTSKPAAVASGPATKSSTLPAQRITTSKKSATRQEETKPQHPSLQVQDSEMADPATDMAEDKAPVEVAHLQGQDSSPESSLTDLSSEGRSSGTKRKLGDNRDYMHFHSKFSPLVELEFRDKAGIHKHSAMSSMWTRHKQLFGPSCSDDCPCVQKIPELTEYVVGDMLKQKKSKWENPSNLTFGDYPVGFAGNFAAIFVPLLVSERPKESASKLMERLHAMWKTHQKQRIWGLECQEGCDCLQGWELKFRKGRLQGETGPEDHPLQSTSNAMGPVPKKQRKPTQNAAAQATDKKSNIASESHIQIHPSKPSAGHQQTSSSLDTSGERRPYEIEFDCTEPLNFYCVTEKAPIKFCKIISINPYCDSDPRLQADTTVLSVRSSKASGSVSLQTHNDLKEQYEEARRKVTPLFITFINDRMPSVADLKYKSSFFKQEWRKDDQVWIGKCKTGFDGGAWIVHQQNRIKTVKAKESISGSAPESFDSGHQTYSINDKQRNQKVHFSEANECRTFLIGSLPTEFLEAKGTHFEAQMQSSPEQNLEKLLPKGEKTLEDDGNFLLSATMEDFLHWLENGGLKSYSSFEQMNKLRMHFKNCSQNLLNQTADAKRKQLKAEVDLKTALLKIHVTASHAIQQSKSLKDWSRIQVHVEKVDSIQINDGIDLNSATSIAGDVTFIGESGTTNQLCQSLIPLPCKPIVHSNGELMVVYGKDAPPYHVNYNPVMTKDRAIEIKLSATGKSGKHFLLGSFHVALAKLHQCCIGNESYHPFSFNVDKGQHLKHARVFVRACSVALESPDYLPKKHNAAQKTMANVIQWTRRFQNDLAAYNSMFNASLQSLGTDVKMGNTGLTPLHAAIYLKDVTFVEQLLSLGAQNSAGSALTLAVNLADRFGKSNALSGGSSGDVDDGEDDDGMDISVDDQVGSSVQEHEFDRIAELLREYRSIFLNTSASENKQTSSGGGNHHSNQARVSTAAQQGQALGQAGSMGNPHHIRHMEPHHSDSTIQQQIPMLSDPNWLTEESHSSLCRDWKKEHFCRFGVGKTCHFLHKHGPWGEHLEHIWKEMDDRAFPLNRTAFRSHVKYKERRVGKTTWYTAGFANFSMMKPLPKTVIYAEGGNQHISSQGLSWYLSKDEAYAALEKAVIVSVWAASRRRRPLAFESGAFASQGDTRQQHSIVASQVQTQSSSQRRAQRRHTYTDLSDRAKNLTSQNHSQALDHEQFRGSSHENFGQWSQSNHHDARHGSFYPNSHNSVQDGSHQWRSVGSESQYQHDNRQSHVHGHQNHWRSAGSGSQPPPDSRGGGYDDSQHEYSRSASFESGRERDYRGGSCHSRRYSK